MEYIFISILFIVQLLTIFWVVILNMKLSKFKELEQKQQKVIAEMDNSIGAYLLEMKDENDRLLFEIQQMTQKQMDTNSNLALNANTHIANRDGETTKPTLETTKHVSKVAVASAYEKHVETDFEAFEQKKVSTILNEVQRPLTFEQKVKKMHTEGQSVEQIAKKTNKGKTEIELLLKFSS